MSYKYINYKYRKLFNTILLFRFSGIATHFVPSNLLSTLREALVNLHHPSLDTINKTIETFAIRSGYIPRNYTLQGRKER